MRMRSSWIWASAECIVTGSLMPCSRVSRCADEFDSAAVGVCVRVGDGCEQLRSLLFDDGYLGRLGVGRSGDGGEFYAG